MILTHKLIEGKNDTVIPYNTSTQVISMLQDSNNMYHRLDNNLNTRITMEII